VLLLQVPYTNNVNHESFFKKFFYGRVDNSLYIPITSYKIITPDSIQYTAFIDEGVTEQKFAKITNFNSSLVRKHTFYLGTDKFGRDLFSRLIIGSRVSLSVGLVAVIISLSIGVFLGALAGYYGGFTDKVIMWFINVLWSIPTVLLAFAITLALGKGYWQIFIAIGLSMWVNVARLVRGQVLVIKEQPYIEAAKVLGFNNARIIVKHILPNIIGPILVIAASNFASAIIIEAGLSFLGIGVQTPQPSWGLLIKENYNFILTNNPFLALVPGIAIMIVVLAFYLLGNALRDTFDIKATTS
jgi:peptide/nickel transport system permease protein